MTNFLIKKAVNAIKPNAATKRAKITPGFSHTDAKNNDIIVFPPIFS
jgi:hypothetical protein